MNRCGWITLCLLVPGVGLSALPPALAQDKITFHDRVAKKDVDAAGAIQSESPSKIVVRPNTGTGLREIVATDIVDVIYEVPARIRLDYTSARGEERKAEIAKEEDRKKILDDAARAYQKLARDLAGEQSKFAGRHLQYKVARLRARQAEDDPALAGEAIESLTRFRKEHPDGWQLASCCRLLARLQLDQGDAEGARKTYSDLAATPGITKETKQDCDLMMARALIRGKKFTEAEQQLQAVLKGLSGDDPQAIRARIHLAECLGASSKLDEAVKQLEDLALKVPQNELKALAYNTLGDCYRTHNRPKDALWPYLWVDVVYFQDKREHARAVEHLARLFDELGDKGRAKQYQDKLKLGMK